MDEKKFKSYDRILVRDGEDETWKATLFSHYDEHGNLRDVAMHTWAYVLPYEGYEHLADTSDSPVSDYQPAIGGRYWTIAVGGFFPKAITVLATWKGETYDLRKKECGLCFRTEAEAKVRAEAINEAICGNQTKD